MFFLVRSRNDGKTYELHIKHSRLPKPVYFTFDVQEDAQRAGQRATRQCYLSLRGSELADILG
jgi:hypothetical protein